MKIPYDLNELHTLGHIPLIISNSSIISPQYYLYLSVGNHEFKAFNQSVYDFFSTAVSN